MLFRNNYYFLSNMFTYPIEYKGIKYSCVESAFQAQKDPTRAREFSNLNGFEAKKLGRRVTLRSDWDKVKLGIMRDILRVKFSSPTLKAKLNSVNEPIVEDNTWGDTYWGKCNGRGLNMLGKLLSELKD